MWSRIERPGAGEFEHGGPDAFQRRRGDGNATGWRMPFIKSRCRDRPIVPCRDIGIGVGVGIEVGRAHAEGEGFPLRR